MKEDGKRERIERIERKRPKTRKTGDNARADQRRWATGEEVDGGGTSEHESDGGGGG